MCDKSGDHSERPIRRPNRNPGKEQQKPRALERLSRFTLGTTEPWRPPNQIGVILAAGDLVRDRDPHPGPLVLKYLDRA